MKVAIWLEHPAESRPLVARFASAVYGRWGVDPVVLTEFAGDFPAHLGLERTLLELPNDPPAFRLALALLTAIDCQERMRYAYPSVYDVCTYLDEPKGLEIWASTRALFARRFGDCEDLACDRAAELIVNGYDAAPDLRHEGTDRAGTDLWHIVTCTPSGCEDPSAALGMGSTWSG